MDVPATGDPPRDPGDSLFLGESEAARLVRKQIGRVAKTDYTVLITGESGVGKELVAREIHARSARKHGPFVPINCAAIPDTLIEAELFGHEPGAFTDARATRRGAFELADGGTLLLDEVGDLSLSAQPKILRSLETGVIQRIGGEREHEVNIRVIAATNQNLQAMSKEKRFRQDLFFRLKILEIHVPPLLERPEDVPFLVNYFAGLIARYQGRPYSAISDDAMRLLTDYSWPGNVRELRSAVERAMVMSSDMVLDVGCFSLERAPQSSSLDEMLRVPWKDSKGRFERAYFTRLLDANGGSVREAARAAGLTPPALYKILYRLGIREPRAKGE
jgi:two-component system nitrogen regulation response regulator NtrX